AYLSGRTDEAVELVNAADSMRSRLGLDPESGKNDRDPVRMIRRDIEFSRRLSKLADCSDEKAFELGMQLSSHATNDRATAPVPTPQPATDATHGLSPRELDVLRLVAAGKTNGEIGEALFISPFTAKTHVANLLGKLGVENRAAAAAWAATQGAV